MSRPTMASKHLSADWRDKTECQCQIEAIKVSPLPSPEMSLVNFSIRFSVLPLLTRIVFEALRCLERANETNGRTNGVTRELSVSPIL